MVSSCFCFESFESFVIGLAVVTVETFVEMFVAFVTFEMFVAIEMFVVVEMFVIIEIMKKHLVGS